MVCTRCGRSRVVEITLDLGRGAVVMRSCSECGIKWSSIEGEALVLTRVLEMASGR